MCLESKISVRATESNVLNNCLSNKYSQILDIYPPYSVNMHIWV